MSTLYPLTPFIGLYSPFWERWLHYSIRLYLALGEAEVNKRQAEIRLRLVERKLLNFLRGYKQPTPESTAQARAILEREQSTLLGCHAEVEEVLSELSAAQAVQQPLYDYLH